MSDLHNSYHHFFKNVGSGSYSGSLPIQTIPESKKTPKWYKLVADRLETIGLNQVYRNSSFLAYRDMYEGRLVHQDISDVSEATQYIDEIAKQYDIPSYIKHFDIIGKIANQIVGEFNNQRDTIRVDSIDSFSRSEILEKKNEEIREYVKKQIDLEIQEGLAKRGIDPQGMEFESEQQKAEYLQQLQAIKSEIVPPAEIEKRLRKDFKTVIVQWAEATLEADYSKFDIEILDTEQLLDYVLTGRYFTHYHLGYDFYKPERWSPETTFFSEDIDIKYPQHGEYAGRMLFISPSDVLQRYGHSIPSNIQEKIFSNEYETTSQGGNTKSLDWLSKNPFVEAHSVPYKGYYERDLANNIQNSMGIPMGKFFHEDENGDQDSSIGWLNDKQDFLGAPSFAFNLRKDIDVRTDLVQVCESYFRGFKLHGILTLESPITNRTYQVTVTEDISKEYLREEGIKNLRTVSLEEAEHNEEKNTIAWFYIPHIYKVKKISAANTKLKEDYVFDYGEMDFQIRGNSNMFDVQLPVAGIITSSICQKIRPYQIKHNLAMNLIENTLEKHVGSFMMMDFGFLASKYKNEKGETSAELLEDWRQNVIDTGIGMYDNSPSLNGNPNSNSPQVFNISHIQDVRHYMNLADYYEQKALAQIGITPTRMGNPSEYASTEGVKQGVQGSYAQTEKLYKDFNISKRKERELHLTVAQYAVKSNKDIVVDYLDKDDSRVIKNFTDENFWLRKIDIIPVTDSTQRKSLEQFRTMMMQNNTLGNDLLDYSKMFFSDSTLALMDYAKQSRERTDKQRQQQMQHEQQVANSASQTAMQQKQMELQHEISENQKDREKDVRIAGLRTIGALADKNIDTDRVPEIAQLANNTLKQEQLLRDGQFKQQVENRKQIKDDREAQVAFQKLNNELQEMNIKREKMNTDRYIAQVNRNSYD